MALAAASSTVNIFKFMDEMGGDPENRYDLPVAKVLGYAEFGGKHQTSATGQPVFTRLEILANAAPTTTESNAPIGSVWTDNVTGIVYHRRSTGWFAVDATIV